jgi:hypothetical protein
MRLPILKHFIGLATGGNNLVRDTKHCLQASILPWTIPPLENCFMESALNGNVSSLFHPYIDRYHIKQRRWSYWICHPCYYLCSTWDVNNLITLASTTNNLRQRWYFCRSLSPYESNEVQGPFVQEEKWEF